MLTPNHPRTVGNTPKKANPRVTIFMTDQVKAQLEELCAGLNMNRSELIRALIVQEHEAQWQHDFSTLHAPQVRE